MVPVSYTHLDVYKRQAQIYNMLRDYKGSVTVKIDGIAASAASVIAMAGDTEMCIRDRYKP